MKIELDAFTLRRLKEFEVKLAAADDAFAAWKAEKENPERRQADERALHGLRSCAVALGIYMSAAVKQAREVA